MNILSLNIIGTGSVGQTLGRLFHINNCFKINGVFNRTLDNRQAAIAFMGAGIPCATLDDLPPADVYMITTPDAEIKNIAHKLSKTFVAQKPSIVFHCSGALPSSVLSGLADDGINIASIHPIMTFAAPTYVDRLTNVYCAFEGDAVAFDILQQAFIAIGAKVFAISTDKKAIYHAANVMACNYLIALMDVAVDLYQSSGLNRVEALTIMQPMVEQTINNVFALQPIQALTGPIARGDVNIIQRHIDGIDNKDIRNLYSLLGLKTVALAAEKGEAAKQSLDKIRDILRSAFDG